MYCVVQVSFVHLFARPVVILIHAELFTFADDRQLRHKLANSWILKQLFSGGGSRKKMELSDSVQSLDGGKLQQQTATSARTPVVGFIPPRREIGKWFILVCVQYKIMCEIIFCGDRWLIIFIIFVIQK